MSTLYYTNDHEWISIDGEIATVGITNYAQEQLGDLVFVDLPESNREFVKGDALVVVESVKAASDVYAPVDGVIVAVNEKLADNPALVNQDAENEGWLWQMRLTDENQLKDLLDKEAYQELIG